MVRVLLDTDMLSEVLKGKNPSVSRRVEAYLSSNGWLTTSAVSVMEIVKGLQKLKRSQRIRLFLETIARDEVLPLDLPSAEIAGQIFGDLERIGQPIGRADPMIAGIAIQHALVLATGNTEHYERIQTLGYPLQIENWRE
ncbi:MAG: PIN domain-containing protein [Planctomycetes bacterium]|nr:PIN domain-containing protein [Planctomycetota bacterium]